MVNKSDGFSLLEIIAALAILGIVVAVTLPVTFRRVDVNREKTTILEMMEIHHAMVGDPGLGTYGFLGDMGKLPETITDLIQQPIGATVFTHTNHTNQVGMGWRGPYLHGFSSDDITRDAWGNLYQYSSTGANAGQIISAGPDRDINTSYDNIVYPADGPVETTGSLLLTVLINRIAEPADVTVNIYSTDNGNESSTVISKTTGDDARGYSGFYFHNLKHGIHAVTVSYVPPNDIYAVRRTVNVGIRANAQKNFKVWLETDGLVSLKRGT